jgi:hypothetical protein
MELILTSHNINTEITPSNTINTEVVITPTDNLIVQPNEIITIDISPSNIINTEIIAPPAIDLTFTDIGVQGLRGVPGVPGDKGENLQFDNLTEQQKMELRGDVGPTSTNYTNIFYDSLLS